jgi:alpha-glucoside transport system substrate-binding protein
MSALLRRRIALPIAIAAAAGLALTGCTTASPGSGSTTGGTAKGGTVSIYGPWSGAEAVEVQASWASWAKKNDITIKYSGDANFAANIATKIQGNSLPDIAIFPQPGLLDAAIKSGKVVESDAGTKANVDKNFSTDWQNYITVGGKLYGTPLDANVKGYVWYSPAEFTKLGISVPKTYADLLTDTATITSKAGQAPWCAGFNSGSASGWPGADWLADLVLRDAGPTVYDQWVAGKVKFTDPRIQSAMDDLGKILKNPSYVNAGFGNVASINSTAFGDVAAPLASGKCIMTHQANFLEAQFGTVKTASGGTPKVGPTGDIWAFMLPPTKAGAGESVTGGGDFAAAFSKDAATTEVMNYLSSAAYVNSLVGAKGSSFISANKGVNAALVTDPLLHSAELTLQDPKTTFRFGADDLMPEAVEAAFWKGMVDWINGDSTSAATTEIQAAWATN